MKSTIRVDFQGPSTESQSGFEPVIRVSLEDTSDDARDKLLRAFFQKLGGDSSWLRVKFEEQALGYEPDKVRITLTPVAWDEMEEFYQVVRERLDSQRERIKQIKDKKCKLYIL